WNLTTQTITATASALNVNKTYQISYEPPSGSTTFRACFTNVTNKTDSLTLSGSYPTGSWTVRLDAYNQNNPVCSNNGSAQGSRNGFGCATGTLTAASTTTTTSISAPTITYNANGSVTVSMTSTAGTVTGNVSLSVDGGTAASKALSSGSATFSNTDIAGLTSPSAGDHTLSASYAAQGNCGAGVATGILHVNPTATTA